MSQVSLQILGSGDAFGSGGRFQTCLLLSGEGGRLLIDCGASSLIAMKRARVDPSGIGWVSLTHLHGDHFGGLPFLILDAQFSRRTRPEKRIKYHLDYRTLWEQRGRLACRRVILTHMSQDMQNRLGEVQLECAQDGQIIVL